MGLYVFNTERSEEEDHSMSCINHSLITWQQKNASDTLNFFVIMHNLIVQHEAYNAAYDYMLDWNYDVMCFTVHIIAKTTN